MNDNNDKNLGTLCKYLYGIYALTMIMQMALDTMLVGMLGMLVALIITYVKQPSAKGTPYETHIQWMLRTFWIGGGVYLPVVTVIGFLFVYPSIDTNAIQESLLSGEITDPNQIYDILLRDNKMLMIGSALATMGPFMAWWLWRCWKGYKALKDGKAVENVMSWL